VGCILKKTIGPCKQGKFIMVLPSVDKLDRLLLKIFLL
jgi:hypothetical protein